MWSGQGSCFLSRGNSSKSCSLYTSQDVERSGLLFSIMRRLIGILWIVLVLISGKLSSINF
ncbi:hypothetical protein J6590_056016 [Homalodisca vitripennis]|nr:hypothetical protein J6590_056016 [Homalodisca vitripennis]